MHGWYSAHEENHQLVCFYGSWHGGLRSYTYTSYGKEKLMTEKERAWLKKQRDDMEAKHKLEQQEKSKNAAKLWQCASKVPLLEEHKAYLQRKRVQGLNLRFSQDKNGDPVALMAIFDGDGSVVGVQMIYADGKKRVHGSKRGNYGQIGDIIQRESTIYITEGYSTGATVHEATSEPIVIAVDCGNLDLVAGKIRAKYPMNRIVIAGDDDKETKGNPGRTHAEMAATSNRCDVIFPRFKDAGAGTDFNDLAETDGMDEVKRQLKDTPMEKKEQEQRMIFPKFKFKDLLNLPPKQWILDRIFGKGDLGMIYGEPGCGKTFIVIDMILSLCQGKMWAKEFDAARAVEVCYCAGEGFSSLAERFKGAMAIQELDDLPNFTCVDKMPQLFLPESQANTMSQFIAECLETGYRPDVLILDTLHTAAYDAEENSAKDVGRILSSCKDAIRELGCSVILLHHTNKGGTSERGSGALRGAMDFMIEIKPPESKSTGYARMICQKLKDGEQWRDKNFTLEKLENFETVYPQWNSLSLEQELQLSMLNNTKGKILNCLINHKGTGKRFTLSELAEVTQCGLENTRKYANQLFSDGKCFREAVVPGLRVSKENQLLYFC